MSRTNAGIQQFYDRIYGVYPVINWFLKPGKKVLAQLVSQQEGEQLLEVGVGTGSHLGAFRRWQVTGIDLSPNMLSRAQRRYSHQGVVLRIMDGEQLDFPDQSFDCIVLSHVLSVTSNPNQMVLEAIRVLRSGGKLIILNHDSPENFLRHLDRLFNTFSRFLQYSSHFNVNNVNALQQLQLEYTKSLRFAAYIKVFIYAK